MHTLHRNDSFARTRSRGLADFDFVSVPPAYNEGGKAISQSNLQHDIQHDI